MDMRVNPEKVKHLRNEKLFSQEEFAIACGLGLRTVQRLEANGKASAETIKAVSAVLGVTPERLKEPVRQFHDYHSTQLGTQLILVFLAVGCLLTWQFSIGVMSSTAFLSLIVLEVLLICLFSTLTVTVNKDQISWHLGLGLIRKSIRVLDVLDHKVVKNKAWWGLGIRRIDRGWLYCVSGTGAIELETRGGKITRIGSDEPEALSDAISQAKSAASRRSTRVSVQQPCR